MLRADLQFATGEELQIVLGERVRRIRLSRNLDQRETAAKADVSVSALRNLETGKGATTATLLRVLKALDALDSLEMLAPDVKTNPVALLNKRRPQLRVHRPRASKKAGNEY